MKNERRTWFWVITAFFILAWSIAGTFSILFITNGDVLLGEISIIITTIILVIIYFVLDWFDNKS